MVNPHIRSLFSLAVPPEVQGQLFGLMSALESMATALTPWIVNQVSQPPMQGRRPTTHGVEQEPHHHQHFPILSPHSEKWLMMLPPLRLFPFASVSQIYYSSPSNFPGLVWLVLALFLMVASLALHVAWRGTIVDPHDQQLMASHRQKSDHLAPRQHSAGLLNTTTNTAMPPPQEV